MRTRVKAAVLGAAALLAIAAPALADMAAWDGNGARITLGSVFSGGVHYAAHVIMGLSGGAPTAVAVDASGAVKTVPAFGASGVTPVTGSLVSSTLTSAFTPPAGRDYFLELTGSGAATVTVEYLGKDGSTYLPEAVATDGGSPTIMNKIAYNGATQNGVRIPLNTGQTVATVKLSPGTVSGTVNFALFVD